MIGIQDFVHFLEYFLLAFNVHTDAIEPVSSLATNGCTKRDLHEE